ncbi:hypothetical protein [Amycolatopsis albispora]|uniref:Uncharacterized protein n=1 Tax=Amycolatopsis albispora TaxID=1804986 RepID=A0A344L6D4_9PSEU|nr:hypothetical protein [Amycolatopsis albispora]AXB43608.1 hypothetical protein A4R43_14565 [Amycolatopsis albispora]
MAVEITSRITSQRVRFRSRLAAERYAEIIGGGLANWEFAAVDGEPEPPVEIPVQARRLVHLVLEDWRRRGSSARPPVTSCTRREGAID